MGRVGAFEITKDKHTGKWAVNVSAKLSRTGKRYRKLFKRKIDAEQYRAGMMENQSHSKSLLYDPELLETAHYYTELFALYGISLAEACSKYHTLLEKQHVSPRLKNLLKKYTTTNKENWSEGMLRMIRWSEKQLKSLLELPITDLDVDFWLDWLPAWKAKGEFSSKSYNHLRSFLSSLYALPDAMKVFSSNPFNSIPPLKIKQKEVSVFTPLETQNLLQSALEIDPEMTPWLAIALFAGLRPESELKRLDWEDINFEEQWIRVNFGNKTDTKRFVDLHPTLVSWLEPYKKEKGKIVLTNHRKRKDKIVELSGVTWARDITRHTYGSYLESEARAKGKDARAIVTANMGHTNYKTYEQHYRNARSAREAEQFWGLSIKKCAGDLPE